LKTIGKLEAEVLCILEFNKVATVSDIMIAIRLKRDVKYSTISSTLDRLYKKSLVDRKVLPGPGGIKYLYSPGNDKEKREIVEASLERLTRAFGATAYDAIYRKLRLVE
jgi:predicted transcriptional regulator